MTTLSCTHHSDCGRQAYCTPAGTCSENTHYGPCDITANCLGTETCDGSHCGCGGQVFTATAVAPNMLIALDRSQSMITNNVPMTTDSRWTVAKRTIKNLTTKYQAGIRFGLVLWPGTTKSCGSPPAQQTCKGTDDAIGIDLGTGTTIGTYLDTAGDCSLQTPIGNSLTELDSYPGFNDPTRANFVVLVTDGDENCGGNGPAAATALRSHNPEVKTYAIGFSSEAGGTVLTQIAINGGTARTGTPAYFQANDEAKLFEAFDTIASSIVSCDYTLSSVPDDPNRLFVFLGQDQLTRDTTHQTGWDYNSTNQHLTFYGASCSQIRSGGQELSVEFGCPVIP